MKLKYIGIKNVRICHCCKRIGWVDGCEVGSGAFTRVVSDDDSCYDYGVAELKGMNGWCDADGYIPRSEL